MSVKVMDVANVMRDAWIAIKVQDKSYVSYSGRACDLKSTYYKNFYVVDINVAKSDKEATIITCERR